MASAFDASPLRLASLDFHATYLHLMPTTRFHYLRTPFIAADERELDEPVPMADKYAAES